jgi:hypothetical protein
LKTLTGAARFDAASSERSFSLGVRDAGSQRAAAADGRHRTSGAIGHAEYLQVSRRELESELAAGTLDAAIDILLPLSNDIRRTQLAGDKTVVLGAARPSAGEAQQADAGDVSGTGAHPTAELAVAGRGWNVELSRQGRATPHPPVLPALLRRLPRGERNRPALHAGALARIVNQQFNNQLLPFPGDAAAGHLLCWHANVDDPPTNVLREQIAAAMQTHG